MGRDIDLGFIGLGFLMFLLSFFTFKLPGRYGGSSHWSHLIPPATKLSALTSWMMMATGMAIAAVSGLQFMEGYPAQVTEIVVACFLGGFLAVMLSYQTYRLPGKLGGSSSWVHLLTLSPSAWTSWIVFGGGFALWGFGALQAVGEM